MSEIDNGFKENGKNEIWLSDAWDDASRVKSFRAEKFRLDLQSAADFTKRYKKAEPLVLEEFPDLFYYDRDESNYKQKDDLISCNGLFVVSGKCADVLRRHDLGTGGLVSTKLVQFDRTPIEGDYFILYFGAFKQAILPEYSKRVRKSYTLEVWRITSETENGDVAVSTSALEGPDLWLDPRCDNAMFLSEKLTKALQDSRVDKYFKLRKCRVIDDAGQEV